MNAKNLSWTLAAALYFCPALKAQEEVRPVDYSFSIQPVEEIGVQTQNLPAFETPNISIPQNLLSPNFNLIPIPAQTRSETASLLSANAPAAAAVLPHPEGKLVSGTATEPASFEARQRRDRFSAAYRFHRSALKAYRWYNMIHTQGLWTDYRQKIADLTAAGSAPAVKRPRAFFASLRAFGTMGERGGLGYTPDAVEKGRLILDVLRVAARHLRGGKSPEVQSALRSYLEAAAAGDDPRHSRSHFRKVARAALSGASLKPAAELAPYFKSIEPHAPANPAMPEDAQNMVLARLRQAVIKALAEENPRAPDRIVAAVLYGSFANGAASAQSDIDLGAVSADGGSGKIKNFAERLVNAWTDAAHPIGFRDEARIADAPDAAYLQRYYYRIPYRVIAASAKLEEDLSPRLGAGKQPSPAKLLPGDRANRAVLYASVYIATLYSSLKNWARYCGKLLGAGTGS